MKIYVVYTHDNQTDTFYIKFLSAEEGEFIVNNNYGLNCICYESENTDLFEQTIHNATNNVPINFKEFRISLSRKDVDKTEYIVNFVKSKIKQRLEYEKSISKYLKNIPDSFNL